MKILSMGADEFVSIKEAAQIIGVSQWRVYQFVHELRLPCAYIGKRKFIKRSDAERFAQIERKPGNPDWRKK